MNQNKPAPNPLVGVVMGSKSDWDTMRNVQDVLEQFGVPHECRIVSAHRTPLWLAEYAAEAEGRGLEVIIAGAGGAAHLPGMMAAQTLLPVLGVPVESKALKWDGLPALHRPDAPRHPRRHPGHRPVRRRERGPARRGHPGQLAAGPPGETEKVSGGADREGHGG